MKVKEEWILNQIEEIKKIIDGNDVETDLMIRVRSLLPYLESDKEFVLNIPEIEAKDRLYIRKGYKKDGKYVLDIHWIM